MVQGLKCGVVPSKLRVCAEQSGDLATVDATRIPRVFRLLSPQTPYFRNSRLCECLYYPYKDEYLLTPVFCAGGGGGVLKQIVFVP